MTHVVCDACINCKRTDCVDVCPVDAFREGPNFLVIDPDECIDCAVCIPECPEAAIYAEEDVPEDQLEFIELNAELAQEWPSISPLPTTPMNGAGWSASSSTSSADAGCGGQASARTSKAFIPYSRGAYPTPRRQGWRLFVLEGPDESRPCV